MVCPFLGDLVCYGLVCFSGFGLWWSMVVSVSGSLVCHGINRLKGIWSVMLLSVSRGFGLSSVRFLGFWSCTELSALRLLSTSRNFRLSWYGDGRF